MHGYFITVFSKPDLFIITFMNTEDLCEINVYFSIILYDLAS